MKNKWYWAYNLPLQVWHIHKDECDETSPVVGTRILNYMPRKEYCNNLDLEECLGDQTREEFFETAALHFENLARLFREVASDPSRTIYYHDDGMEK
jgi:hypothetical protein